MRREDLESRTVTRDQITAVNGGDGGVFQQLGLVRRALSHHSRMTKESDIRPGIWCEVFLQSMIKEVSGGEN